jgi:hypothetical protein
MNKISPAIFLGDVVRALAALKPGTPEGVEAVAALLGFRLPPGWRSGTPGADALPPPEPQAVPSPPPPPRPPELPLRPVKPPIPAPEPVALSFEVQHLRHAQPSPASAPQAEQPAPPARPPRPVPLFRPGWARAILTEALATSRTGRDLDLPRAIELLARRSVADLPRLRLPTLARGCLVLADLGPGLAPFALDRQGLVETVRAVVGRDRVAVRYFEGCPLRGVWEEGVPGDDPLVPPPRGTPVAVITDLGIARPGLAAARAWLDFAAGLRAAGCPLVAFVPYPPHRWPAAPATAFPVVHWDRGCTARTARRAREAARS